MSVEFIDALGGMNAVGYRAGKYVGHRIPGSQIRATLARGDFTGNVPFKVCSNGYSSYFYDENVRANRLKLNDLPALTDGRTCFFFFLSFGRTVRLRQPQRSGPTTAERLLEADRDAAPGRDRGQID